MKLKIDKSMYLVLGSHLRIARERSNKSLEEVASAVGLTKKTIQRYEVGESRITISTLKSICNFLNTDYDQFNIMVNREVESKRKMRFIDCCFEFCNLNPEDYQNINDLEKEIIDVVVILSKKYKR